VIHWMTGFCFVLWKSPVAQPFIDGWNRNMSWTIGRTVDWTDLIALAVLPVGYYGFRSACRPVLSRGRPIVVGAALLAFAATSYRTDYSYERTYLAPVTAKRLLDQMAALAMQPWPKGSDSVSIEIPSRYCFERVTARITILPTGDGTSILLSELMHQCPRRKGDSLELLSIFEHCFLKRLDSALAKGSGTDTLTQYIRPSPELPRPRDGCGP
jgi:hypothetical protein